MILYVSSNWFGLIFNFTGTVWPHIRTTFLCITLYSIVAYVIADYYKINFGTEGRTILLGTMSFLLIFRANQAYARYWQGRCAVSAFFSEIRELIMLSFTFLRGGVASSVNLYQKGVKARQKSPIEDFCDCKAREMRFDIIRLSISLACALQLHTRICSDGYCMGSISKETKWRVDWDRFRLRQLLTQEEFELVDGCVGVVEETPTPVEDVMQTLAQQYHGISRDKEAQSPPDSWPDDFEVNQGTGVRPAVVIAFLLRQVVFRNMNGPNNDHPWGEKDRFVAGLSGLISTALEEFEAVSQIIETPLPLPYVNLCKTLLATFLLSMPFFVDYKLGWFANTVIPSLISLALLGIDGISSELENPFGDDSNDLDILEAVNVLEHEAMEMLALTGDEICVQCFAWRPLPRFIKEPCCKSVHRYIVALDLAAGEE